MSKNSESNGCFAPIAAGVFVFLVTLIGGDFWKALGTGIVTFVVWGFIILFLGNN